MTGAGNGLRRMRVLTLALTTITAATGPTGAWPAESRGGAAPVLDVPFDFATRQPIVPVRVNGQPASPFVVDTGASVHVIDADLARRAGAVAGAARDMRGGGAGTVSVASLDGLTLHVGGLSWSGERAVAAPLGYPAAKHYAGLVGAPILSRYVVQFAYDGNRLRLFEPAAYVPPAGATELPFEIQEGLPIVTVVVDVGAGPIDARLMVDTGASQFVDLNTPFVERHALDGVMPDAAPADRRAALGTPASFVYGTARRVVVAGKVFERPRVGLSRSTSGSSSRADRDGIIGNDLLRHFIVTVDYYRKRIWLELSRP